jgi:hypothetical protein
MAEEHWTHKQMPEAWSAVTTDRSVYFGRLTSSATTRPTSRGTIGSVYFTMA